MARKTFCTEFSSLSGMAESRSKYRRSKKEEMPCKDAAENSDKYVAKYLGYLALEGVSEDAEKQFLCSLWQIMLAISEMSNNGKLEKEGGTRS